MRNRAVALLSAALGLGAVPLPLSAQATPIGEQVQFCSSYRCPTPEVVALADGGFAVAYSYLVRLRDEEELWVAGGVVDRFDSDGVWIAERRFGYYYSWADPKLPIPEAPSLCGQGAEALLLAWQARGESSVDLLARRLSNPDLTFEAGDPWPVGPQPPGLCRWAVRSAANASGRFWLAWHESPTCRDDDKEIVLRAFNSDRLPASPPIRISRRTAATELRRPLLATDSGGRSLLLWEDLTTTDGKTTQRLFARRFGSDGRPLGKRFQVGPQGGRGAALAMLPDGTFLVAWTELFAVPQRDRIVFRWFAPTGVPVSPRVPVADDELVDAVAVDRHGNLALLSTAANSFGTVRLRLFNRALVAQGEPLDLESLFFAPPVAQVVPQETWAAFASVAMLDSGRLFAAWEGEPDYHFPPYWRESSLGQAVQARHDADACAFRSEGFACDTAGDGGEAEETIAFRPGSSEAQPLLADWDGDGRADPCVYQGGRFACDTAHDGGVAESETPAIGRAGDRPLLGDLDGDGKADPCVRRGVSFLCDRARDGGAKDLRIDFGRASDFPLFGDPDGDGRDDPCVYRNGRFLCDTAHDGGTAELALDLRRPVPGRPAGTPLLGDLDGNGRDEACFATQSERICGFFHLTGGQPYRVERLAFGHAGEVPLMGDLDAF